MAYLSGKTAIITGAADGLGKAFADALAAEGACVSMFDLKDSIHQAAEWVSRHGLGVLARMADVSHRPDCEAIVTDTIGRFGSVDILVNNAAKWKETLASEPWERALADFDEIMDTNLKGVMMMIRLCVPHMVARGSGDIVNISTDYVMPARRDLSGLNPHDTDVYNASKWAMNGLTDAAAQFLEPYRIRVNALAVGPTDTPIIHSLFAPGGKLHGLAVEGRIPPQILAQLMDPRDIARLLIELLKDGRTGENIGIWSGHPITLGPRKRVDVKLRERADFTGQPSRDFGVPPWTDAPEPLSLG